MLSCEESALEVLMGSYVRWIEHKGKRILFADYSGIKEEAVYLQAIEETEAELLGQAAGRTVLMLLDVTDTRLTPTITERSKQMAAAAEEKGIPQSPTAMVGLSGFQKAIVQAMQFFHQGLYTTDSIEAAKEWLVSRMDT